MSHSMGFYYVQIRYSAQYKDDRGNRRSNDNFKTAYRSQKLRTSHDNSQAWYIEKVKPVMEDDVRKFISCQRGGVYDAFSFTKVEREQGPMFRSTLPTTTSGDRQGLPYGKEVRA